MMVLLAGILVLFAPPGEAAMVNNVLKLVGQGDEKVASLHNTAGYGARNTRKVSDGPPPADSILQTGVNAVKKAVAVGRHKRRAAHTLRKVHERAHKGGETKEEEEVAKHPAIAPTKVRGIAIASEVEKNEEVEVSSAQEARSPVLRAQAVVSEAPPSLPQEKSEAAEMKELGPFEAIPASPNQDSLLSRPAFRNIHSSLPSLSRSISQLPLSSPPVDNGLTTTVVHELPPRVHHVVVEKDIVNVDQLEPERDHDYGYMPGDSGFDGFDLIHTAGNHHYG